MNKLEVKLTKYFSNPNKIIASAAKTCYSKNGIIFEENIDPTKTDDLILDLFKAGHHTNFEHCYFQFAIKNVSRYTVWNLLHSHPFYNSEQVSQRYTEVKDDYYYVPELNNSLRDQYIKTSSLSHSNYKNLSSILEPIISEKYYKTFPARKKNQKKYLNDIRKKCQEIARYVLPIGTLSYLYHTINLITLIRYYIFSNSIYASCEEKYLVHLLINEVANCDQDFERVFKKISNSNNYSEDELLLDQNIICNSNQYKKDFDTELEGSNTKLVDYNIQAESLLSEYLRNIIGLSKDQISDEDAIGLILDPGKNRSLQYPLVMGTMQKNSQALSHIHYTFKKKLSHSADSQNQRHRTIKCSKLLLQNQNILELDYITPKVIEESENIKAEYKKYLENLWGNINTAHQMGLDKEYQIYLLPNAFPIRMYETGNLLNYYHKFHQRLCFNAQEEILNCSINEVSQIMKVHPNIGKYLFPPCKARYLTKQIPFCPEGKRFCGIKVWSQKIENYNSLL